MAGRLGCTKADACVRVRSETPWLSALRLQFSMDLERDPSPGLCRQQDRCHVGVALTLRSERPVGIALRGDHAVSGVACRLHDVLLHVAEAQNANAALLRADALRRLVSLRGAPVRAGAARGLPR